MGKKSRRPGRNKPKRSREEIFLAYLDFPIPLPVDAASPPRDNRQLADYCFENLRCLHKQNELRYDVFFQYMDKIEAIMLSEDREDAWYKRHIKFLRKMANDETDLTYFRVESLCFLSLRYFLTKEDYEGMTDCLEKVLTLCKNASELEKSRRLPSGLLLSEELSVRQRHAEEHLDVGYNKLPFDVFKANNKIIQVPLSAGNQCDNCQKSKAEQNVERMSCCTRCQFEYYCSKECQRTACKNGHKELCPAVGEFHPGDQAHHVHSPRTEQVQLVEYLDGEDSWVVINLYGVNQRTVPTKDLRRIRPALWHCPEKYKSNVKSG